MKSVIVRLQEYEKHASNAEKKFVEFLLKHPEQAVGCSMERGMYLPRSIFRRRTIQI